MKLAFQQIYELLNLQVGLPTELYRLSNTKNYIKAKKTKERNLNYASTIQSLPPFRQEKAYRLQNEV